MSEPFKTGDHVRWNTESEHPRIRQKIQGMVRQYGDGPFTIVKARKNRGTARVAAGHDQSVTIRLPDGSIPQMYTRRRPAVFSGVWFIHA